MRAFFVCVAQAAVLLVAASFCMAAPGGQSPEPSPDSGSTDATRLDEVVVTATAEPSQARKLPVHVQVFDRKAIDRSGADTLAQFLNKRTPATYITYPGASTSIGMRGVRSFSGAGADVEDRVLVLVDGHRAGTGNLAAYPLDNVERVEVMRGPGSVLYGGSAMGGVINVITRRGRGDASGSVQGQYGSFDASRVSAGVSGGLKDDVGGYSLAVRSVSRGNYSAPGHGEYENTAYNDRAASGSVTYRPSTSHEFNLMANYFNVYDTGSPDAVYNPASDQKVEDTNAQAALSYDGKAPSSDLAWHLSGYAARHEREFTDAAWYDDSLYDTSTLGARGHFSLPTFSFGRFTLGGEYTAIEEEHEGGPGTSGIYSPDFEYDIYALFAEETVEWNRLSLVLGARYDNYGVKTRKNKAYTDVESDRKDFDHLTWRAGASYSALDWLSLRASVGTAFVAPRADKLSSKYSFWGQQYIGNENLDPETSTTYEGGLDMAYGGFNGALTYFVSDYEDAITTERTTVDGDPNWTTWTNSEGRRIAGLEWFLDYTHSFAMGQTTFAVRPYLNGSYLTDRKERDSDLTDARGTDIPLSVSEYSLTTGVELGYDDWISLDVWGYFAGPQKIMDYDMNSSDYMQVVDKDGFNVFSARLSVRPMEHLKTWLQLDNVFDEKYAYVDGYPMPGAGVSVGLAYTF